MLMFSLSAFNRRCPVPTYGTEHAFRCAPFDLRISRLLRPNESVRVATGGHEKSDDLPTIVDPIDCGRADALGIIDRRKVSVVKDETVGETRSIRSEEHTSELQSHLNLVCRLL